MAATIAILLVAVLHIIFMILEMALWQRPAGRRIFGLSAEFARQSAALAANQGLYNGFLAAGLCWSLTDQASQPHTSVFFLGCVIAAGIFGAITVNRSILWLQAAPAVIALALVYLS